MSDYGLCHLCRRPLDIADWVYCPREPRWCRICPDPDETERRLEEYARATLR